VEYIALFFGNVISIQSMNLCIIKNIIHPSPFKKPILYDIYFNKNFKRKEIILFLHGYKSFKDWGPFNHIAHYFAKAGYIFIKFNFSHNGTTIQQPDKITDSETFGHNNIEIEVEETHEMIRNIDTIDQLPCEEMLTDKIYLMGHSRGGSIAMIAAKENHKVKKLVTWSAMNDFPATWAKFYDMKQWKEKGVNYRPNKLTGQDLPVYYDLYLNYEKNADRFNLKNVISELNIPFMVVHGIEDEYIPFENALEIKKWNSSVVLNLMPYSNHNLGATHPYPHSKLSDELQFVCKQTDLFFKGNIL